MTSGWWKSRRNLKSARPERRSWYEHPLFVVIAGASISVLGAVAAPLVTAMLNQSTTSPRPFVFMTDVTVEQEDEFNFTFRWILSNTGSTPLSNLSARVVIVNRSWMGYSETPWENSANDFPPGERFPSGAFHFEAAHRTFGASWVVFQYQYEDKVRRIPYGDTFSYRWAGSEDPYGYRLLTDATTDEEKQVEEYLKHHDAWA